MFLGAYSNSRLFTKLEQWTGTYYIIDIYYKAPAKRDERRATSDSEYASTRVRVLRGPSKPYPVWDRAKKWGKSAKILHNLHTVITWVSRKLFEVCKSLKYSSGNWLSDYDTQEPHQDTPVLHNSI